MYKRRKFTEEFKAKLDIGADGFISSGNISCHQERYFCLSTFKIDKLILDEQ